MTSVPGLPHSHVQFAECLISAAIRMVLSWMKRCVEAGWSARILEGLMGMARSMERLELFPPWTLMVCWSVAEVSSRGAMVVILLGDLVEQPSCNACNCSEIQS
jgi:hypothetical protein